MKEYLDYRKETIEDKTKNDPNKDIEFGKQIRDLKNYQIPPSTTLRKASTELRW
jgi:hypothetical protein